MQLKHLLALCLAGAVAAQDQNNGNQNLVAIPNNITSSLQQLDSAVNAFNSQQSAQMVLIGFNDLLSTTQRGMQIALNSDPLNNDDSRTILRAIGNTQRTLNQTLGDIRRQANEFVQGTVSLQVNNDVKSQASATANILSIFRGKLPSGELQGQLDSITKQVASQFSETTDSIVRAANQGSNTQVTQPILLSPDF